MTPVVSACIISYKQEAFIEATLSGAMRQQLNVPFEIVVGDDSSPDSTLSIIERLASQNSSIRILGKEKNLGMHGNWARTIKACNGKYIALCEGDDIWNDPMKLQKQIDLLEKNPNASACFSNADVLNEDGSVSPYAYVDKEFGVLSAKDFFELNFNPVPTCTLVFRRSCFQDFPPAYFQSPFADWILHTLLIQKGDYIYLPKKTSTYRKHDGGVWSGIREEKQLQNKLKALRLIRSIVDDSFKDANASAIRKQLDKLLYFYREQKQHGKFWKTWLELKMMAFK